MDRAKIELKMLELSEFLRECKDTHQALEKQRHITELATRDLGAALKDVDSRLRALFKLLEIEDDEEDGPMNNYTDMLEDELLRRGCAFPEPNC